MNNLNLILSCAVSTALCIGLVILSIISLLAAALITIWLLWHARREAANTLTFNEGDMFYSRKQPEQTEVQNLLTGSYYGADK